jgi:hypothetical protein
MKEKFRIELAERKKINKVGKEITAFGAFFFILFLLCLLPAKYLPSEVAVVYLIEIVHRNVYIVLSSTFSIILFGEWLKGMRKYEKGELVLTLEGIKISSTSKKVFIKFDKIKKIKGLNNLVHNKLNRFNFIIKTTESNKVEIRANSDIFNALTDYFPNK